MPVTVAAKLALCPVVTLNDAGDTVTTIGALAAIVIEAKAVCVPAIASIVTGLAVGTAAGAVYVAVREPVAAIVPTPELPPAIPFTIHATGVPGATHRDAVRFNATPVATLDDAGEIEFAEPHEIATMAAAAFVVSATLVTVTDTDAGDGGIAGAVYVAASALVMLSVPRDAFPPLTPFTVQFTADVCVPVPVTVAVKAAVAPGVSAADVGAMLTATPL